MTRRPLHLSIFIDHDCLVDKGVGSKMPTQGSPISSRLAHAAAVRTIKRLNQNQCFLSHAPAKPSYVIRYKKKAYSKRRKCSTPGKDMLHQQKRKFHPLLWERRKGAGRRPKSWFSPEVDLGLWVTGEKSGKGLVSLGDSGRSEGFPVGLRPFATLWMGLTLAGGFRVVHIS